MRLIVLLFTIHLCCETSSIYHNGQARAKLDARGRRTRSIPRRFEQRIWKRQDDLGYLEQCSILQFWDKQIGRVNVLAFFDSSWQFSHRQAAMLKVLRERFERTGFRHIQFFAVNAAAGEARYIDRAEVEAEEETWKQISPSEADGVPPIVATPEALVEALGPHIYFIQDNDELEIWLKLRAFRDQILVIDRCGRLTYQIIVPWSILHFPYVKAAILSTYKDEPCGHCEFQESPFDTTSSEKYTPPSTTESPATSPQPPDPSNNTTPSPEDSPTGLTENYHSQIASEESSTVPPDASVADSLDEPTTLLAGEAESTTAPMSEESSPPATESTELASAADEQSTLAYQTDEATTSTEAPAYETESSFDTSTGAIYDSTVFEFNEDGEVVSFATEDSLLDDDYSGTTASDFETTTGIGETTTAATAVDEYDTDAVSEEQQIAKTEIPVTTTEASNVSLACNESRLREAEEIESIDTRDVLKSRSTNARSVSPNDGSVNHLEDVETSSEPSQSLDSAGNNSDYLLPIRIIMRAPHVDEYSDRTMKAHEYLVLKTGEPDYHEHLEEESVPGESPSEERRHVRKKEGALGRTFGKDESPGLYGEVADYWRNFGNEQQLTGSTQTSGSEEEDEEEEEEAEDEEQILGHDAALGQDKLMATPASATQPSGGRGSAASSHEPPARVPDEEIEFDSEKPYDNNSDANEDVDVVDEEAKSKLIAHYSKLLPWLYYVLAK